MPNSYTVDYLPNGLIRVFDFGTKWTICFTSDGTYCHGPMHAATLADLLRQLDNDERIRQREADDPERCRKCRRYARRQRAWHRSRWANAAACAPYVAPTSRRARPPLFRRQQRTVAADVEATLTPSSLPPSCPSCPFVDQSPSPSAQSACSVQSAVPPFVSFVDHPPAAPRRRSPWMPRILLSIAAIFLIVGLWLTFVQPWLFLVTAPQAHRGALWRASLPSLTLDLGLDACPAAPGQAGYVELWAYQYDADDIQMLLHLFGTPALPLEPPLRSAPPAEPAAPIPLVPVMPEPQIRL